MRSLTCILLIMLSLPLSSQTWQWGVSEGYDSHASRPNVVVSDKYANVYIASLSYSTGVHIIKFSHLGVKQWEKTYNGGAVGLTSLSTDESGNLYAVFWATNVEGTTYDPSLGAVLFTKYDPNGNLIWIKQITYRLLLSERTDSSDYIIGTGTYTDTLVLENGYVLTVPSGDSRYFIARYNANGDCIWAIQEDGGKYPLDISVNGEMFAKGEVYAPTPFGKDSNQIIVYPSYSGGEYFAKYDGAANLN